MASDVPESVYLNAARAECLIQFSYDPNFYSSDVARRRAINADTAIRARDPFLRAAVESVWEARGEHDAAAIQRLREGARTGVELIAVERRRQIEDEGLVPEHDAEHDRDQLARAAVCYAAPPERRSMRWHNVSAVGGTMPDRGDRHVHAPADWPWHPDSWKPGDRVRELVKAGALIAAEIDRLAALDGGQPDTPAPPAEPAIDVVTGQPCTIYVPPEDCSTPRSCRVHRGAYPAPAPTQRGLADRPNRWGCYDPQCEDSTWDHDCPVVPVGGEGRSDAD